MTKQKANSVRRASEAFTRRVADSFLVFGGVFAILHADYQWQLAILFFGTFWVASDTIIWVYNSIVRPAAKAVYEQNK